MTASDGVTSQVSASQGSASQVSASQLSASQGGAALDAGTARQPRRAPLLQADSLGTAMVLSATVGLLDAFTYTGHGHAFASFVTGNMILFAIDLTSDRHVGARAFQVAVHLLPVLAYVGGAMLASALLRRASRGTLSAARVALLVEILTLGVLAMLADALDDRVLMPILTMSTALQNTTFRSIGKRTYNSAFMTGNLQALSGLLFDALAAPTDATARDARVLGAVIGCFICGAACGGLLTPVLRAWTLLVPAVALALLWMALRPARR